MSTHQSGGALGKRRPIQRVSVGGIILLFFWLSCSSSTYAQTEFNILAETANLKSEYQKELDKWMLRAYGGDRDAQFKVAVLFANDQFGPPDHEQSAYWYTQAARQGHVLAQYNLGHQYLLGNGVKRDENIAMQWWLKAAEQQHALSQFNVGRAYYLGIGLDKDLSQAKLWFERASQNNEPKSTEILKQLGWWQDASDEATLANNQSTQEQNQPAQPSTDEDSAWDLSSQSSDAVSSTTDPQEDSSDSGELAQNQTIQVETTSESVASTTDSPSQIEDGLVRPLAVFTNPSVRSVLITILDDPSQLQSQGAESAWTRVTQASGFPVWVSKNFIRAEKQNGTVTGSSVNARAVPLITTGTVVGRLNKGEQVKILDSQGEWYRIQSPERFVGWVKTNDYLAKTTSEPTPIATPTPIQELEPDIKVEGNLNDNSWLFKQRNDAFTLQLASFSDNRLVNKYLDSLPFKESQDIRLFTATNDEGTKWTYILYGNYLDNEDAKRARVDLKQQRAWIRSFGVLQQNRCLAWKRELPAPSELNEYCI